MATPQYSQYIKIHFSRIGFVYLGSLNFQLKIVMSAWRITILSLFFKVITTIPKFLLLNCYDGFVLDYFFKTKENWNSDALNNLLALSYCSQFVTTLSVCCILCRICSVCIYVFSILLRMMYYCCFCIYLNILCCIFVYSSSTILLGDSQCVTNSSIHRKSTLTHWLWIIFSRNLKHAIFN